jgi:hypothetical protein
MHGKNGVAALEADYRFGLAPEVLTTVKGLYLESILAGIGGEVLWRPQSQRWAAGAACMAYCSANITGSSACCLITG